ncbi:MAG: ATP-binding protein, partial [Bacteroidota bacterium]
IKQEAASIHEKNHKINILGSLPEVYAVESYMKIVLQNLILNGLKYNEKDYPQVAVMGKKEGNQVMISVVDNGIGIDKEYLDKIFVPFKRLHSEEEYEGTGFGLAITKHLIEKLNGEMEVVSLPGVGSVFTAVLKEPA